MVPPLVFTASQSCFSGRSKTPYNPTRAALTRTIGFTCNRLIEGGTPTTNGKEGCLIPDASGVEKVQPTSWIPPEATEAHLGQAGGKFHVDSSVAFVSPIHESSAGDAPNLLSRIVRESPDAVARAAIVAAAGTLFWLTWARWGDLQLDNGRELYVPLEILRRKLYRDIFYAFGPLAPYAEALLLGLFGQHLYVLYIFGLATTIADALVLFNIGTMVEGRAVGLTAAVAVLLQGFQPTEFNYVFPWSYAGSLSLLLGLLCLCFTLRHIIHGTGRDLVLAGLAAGLALLCKQEFGLVCYVLLAFVLLMETALHRSVRVLLRSIALCTPGVVLWALVYGWIFWSLTPSFMLFDNWVEIPGSYYMRIYGAHWAAFVGLRFNPFELAVWSSARPSASLFGSGSLG